MEKEFFIDKKLIDLTKFSPAFLEFEKDEKLFEINIKGHPFWDCIRYDVFKDILYPHFEAENSQSTRASSPLKFLGNLLADLLDYLKINLGFVSKRYDLVFIYMNRDHVVNNRKINILLHPVIEKLSARYRILMMNPVSLKNRIEGNYPCEIIGIGLMQLMDRIKARFVRFDSKEKNIISTIQRKLFDRFQSRKDIETLSRTIYADYVVSYKRYKKLFERLCPRAIVGIDDGRIKSMLEAAKSLNIPTVELQHGAASPLCIFFQYHPDIKKEDIKKTNWDYTLSFGDFWNHRISQPSRRVSVGFPFLERMIKAHGGKNKDGDKSIIIIGDLVSKKRLVEIALRLADLLPDYILYYKLRTEDYSNWEERYPKEFSSKPNLKIIDNNQKSVYEYYEICNFIIGESTTAIYEALAFGLQAFIIRSGWFQEMASLYENGLACLISTPEELADKIKNNHRLSRTFDINNYFKKDGLANIEMAISQIVSAKYGKE